MYLFQLIKERFGAGTPYNQPIGNCGKNTLKWKSALTVIGKKYKDLRRFNFCEKNLINSVTWITLNLLLPSQFPLDGSGPASCPRMIKQIEYSLNAIISNNLKLWNSSWGTSCSEEKRLIHSFLPWYFSGYLHPLFFTKRGLLIYKFVANTVYGSRVDNSDHKQ